MTRSLLATALSCLAFVACDQGTDAESLKQTIGGAVQDNLASVKTAHEGLAGAHEGLAETQKSLDQRLTTTNERLDEVLDKLAALDERLTTIDGKIAAPPPTAKPTLRPGRPDPAMTYRVPLGDAQTRGKDTALVTIVEWSDFQCPFCKRVPPTLKTLETKYGDDLRIAFKHNPLAFHKDAMSAAIAAEAAGKQGKFWEMHDKLFENNKSLTNANFKVWAGELGLDAKRFNRDLSDSGIRTAVEKMQAEGVTLGARGTPAFFVNGRFLSGAQPAAAFQALIDEEMTKAKALVASGVSRKDVYAKTIALGATKPE